MSTIADQLREIANQLDGQAGATSAAAMIYPGTDGLAIVDGIALYIDEPIRADWKMGLARVPLAAERKTGAEPSNAFNSGLPKRSPAGYPMFYGHGQYGPQPPGRVLYDGSTFGSDEEIEQYKQAAIVRAGNLEAWERERSRQVFTGPVPAMTLSANDAAYLWWKHGEHVSRNQGDLFLLVLAGTYNEIANAKLLGDVTNPGSKPWAADNPVLVSAVEAAMR